MKGKFRVLIHSMTVATRYLLLFCSWFFCASSEAITVRSELQKCPICGRNFITTSIGSWFQSQSPNRDFSESLFSAMSQAESCPHCLYSALPEDFDTPKPEEVARIRKTLETLAPNPLANPKACLTNTNPRMELDSLRVLQYRLTEICDADRHSDPGRTARISYAAYLSSKPPINNNKGLFLRTRREAIVAIEKSLTAKSWSPVEAVTWTYLKGELQRRYGDLENAIRSLEEAAKLSEKSNSHKDLRIWALEQLEMARRGETNSPSESFSMGPKPEALRKEVSEKLPEMLKALRSGKPWRDRHLKTEDPDAIISVILRLGADGNRDAASFLFTWLATLTSKDLKKSYSNIPGSVQVLASHHHLLNDPEIFSVKFSHAGLGEIAAYAVGRGELSSKITSAIKNKTIPGNLELAAVYAAVGRRDPSLKTTLLKRMVKGTIDGNLVDAVQDYFLAVGTSNDIKALEKFSEIFKISPNSKGFDWIPFYRQDIEQVILAIRLREMFPDWCSSDS